MSTMSSRNLRLSIVKSPSSKFEDPKNSLKALKNFPQTRKSSFTIKQKPDTTDLESYFPQWLLKRNDFQKFLKEDQSFPEKFFHSASIPCSQRTFVDNQNIINWLMYCKLTKNMKVCLLLKFAKGIQTQEFCKGFKFEQNYLSDKVMMVVSGCVGVFRNGVKVKILKGKETFGVVFPVKWPCDFICLSEVKVAFVDSSVLIGIFSLNSQKISQFVFNILCNCPAFGTVSRSKLSLLSEKFVKGVYLKDDFVYTENEKCEQFFILKSGEIELQKNLELTQKHNLPIKKILISKKKYNYIIKTLAKGSICGLEDFLSQEHHSCSAKVQEVSKVFSISQACFHEILNEKDIESIKKNLGNSFPRSKFKEKFVEDISKSLRRLRTIFETVEKTEPLALRNGNKKKTWADGATEYYNSITTSRLVSEKIEFQNIFSARNRLLSNR